MFQSNTEKSSNRRAKKLRTACDSCHQNKTKCSGENPCAACVQSEIHCSYSVSNKIGRPKGARNKKTLERASRRPNSIGVGNSPEGSNDASQNNKPAVALQWLDDITDNSIPIQADTDCDIFEDIASIEAFQGSNPDNLLFQPSDGDWWSCIESLGSSNESTLSSSKSSKTSIAPNYGYTESALISPATSQREESGAGNDFGIAVTASRDVGTASACGFQDLITISDIYTPITPLEYPSATAAENSLSTPISLSDTLPCSCLQQNADVLCRLKSVKTQHASPSIDVLLVGADQALAEWKNLLECRNCQQNEDQEVLLLSAMSMRVILRSLQNLYLGVDEGNDHGGEVTLPSNHDAGVRKSLRRTNSIDNRDSVRSTIGVYEVTGVERMLVTDLLLSRTLGKIKVVLRCLQERSESAMRKEKRVSLSAQLSNLSSIDESDRIEGYTEPLQQLLAGLDGTVQRIMRWLRNDSIGNPCG